MFAKVCTTINLTLWAYHYIYHRRSTLLILARVSFVVIQFHSCNCRFSAVFESCRIVSSLCAPTGEASRNADHQIWLTLANVTSILSSYLHSAPNSFRYYLANVNARAYTIMSLLLLTSSLLSLYCFHRESAFEQRSPSFQHDSLESRHQSHLNCYLCTFVFTACVWPYPQLRQAGIDSL